jgi:hypothetical protein
MKKVLVLVFLLGMVLFLSFREIRDNIRKDLLEPVSLPSSTPSPEFSNNSQGVRISDVSRSVFVPYWGINESLSSEDYEGYLYFGIAPDEDGIDRGEAGFVNIDKFIDRVPSRSKKLLVVRMLDSDTTFPILKEPVRQDALIEESIATAREKGFSGIVLDLEISAVPFDSLVKQVNVFTKTFYKEVQKSDLEFSIMFYGDNFYRLRPFEVKTLSQNADKFFIMSYDFSKSRGNPGPNFPLKGKEVYGYDMTEMVDDFLQYLPPEKTTVVFGLFGYDWEVDDKGVSTEQGTPLTYKQIEAKFLKGCTYAECSIRRKNDSFETEVRYRDDKGKGHIVWFEDAKSVEEKEKYLRMRGIGSFSLWAYSYF